MAITVQTCAGTGPARRCTYKRLPTFQNGACCSNPDRCGGGMASLVSCTKESNIVLHCTHKKIRGKASPFLPNIVCKDSNDCSRLGQVPFSYHPPGILRTTSPVGSPMHRYLLPGRVCLRSPIWLEAAPDPAKDVAWKPVVHPAVRFPSLQTKTRWF